MGGMSLLRCRSSRLSDVLGSDHDALQSAQSSEDSVSHHHLDLFLCGLCC